MKTIGLMRIYSLIFFLLNVAPSLQGLFSVIGLDQPLIIPPGEDAVLPCHLSPQINAENMTIRWFRNQYQKLVHLYRDREDQNQNRMAEYRNRTTLIKDDIISGSVSLIIHNVREFDSGLYTCFYDNGFFYEEAALELKVAGLGSKPHIHLQDLQNGGIAVVCDSSGWYPEPEAQWKDEDGNNMSSSTEVKPMDGKLQFHVKMTYMLNGHASRLSCCIGNPILSEWKQSTLHIRDAFFQRISSCLLSRLLISAFFTALGILLISWTVQLVNEPRERSKELGRLQEERDWRRARRLYAAAVTLDPDTAHPRLVVSLDGRRVRDGVEEQDRPDTGQRFDVVLAVLGRERLSSGGHYWEVDVGDKTDWILGVCNEAASRRGKIRIAPEEGYWTIWFRDGGFEALDSSPTPLTHCVPTRAVGFFLDCEAGRLSVYNVDGRSLLFTFSRVSSPHKLRPYFMPRINYEGRNAAPLRILSGTGWESERRRDLRQMRWKICLACNAHWAQRA